MPRCHNTTTPHKPYSMQPQCHPRPTLTTQNQRFHPQNTSKLRRRTPIGPPTLPSWQPNFHSTQLKRSIAEDGNPRVSTNHHNQTPAARLQPRYRPLQKTAGYTRYADRVCVDSTVEWIEDDPQGLPSQPYVSAGPFEVFKKGERLERNFRPTPTKSSFVLTISRPTHSSLTSPAIGRACSHLLQTPYSFSWCYRSFISI